MNVSLRSALAAIPIGLWAFAAACGGSHSTSSSIERPVGATVQIEAPLGLTAVSFPKDNPPTADTIALGRRLFYEPRLSGDASLSCASCHNPALGFTDRRPVSTGFGGKVGTRNAPTVVNAAYYASQFWDGRAPDLEQQARGPISNPIEMNQTHEVCAHKLEEDPSYKAAFQKAFGPGPVTIGRIGNALASFERTLISGNSAFDRYYFGGDKKALTPAAIRGLAIFRDKQKGNCVSCHVIGDKDALFFDGKFHNIGAGVNGEGELIDLGRYTETKIESDKGSFKTPTLRNVARTAPYMHDGSLRTLRDVVDFYAGGGNSNPYLDKEIKTIKLSGQERADLVAFLESLTGEMPPDAGPPAASSQPQGPPTLRQPQ